VSAVEALPTLNAALNLTSATLLVLGWRAIRRGERARHRALMLGAVAASALFLVSYLTRVALTGTHRFPGEGALKVAYLAVLASHTLLAVVVAPMVLRALFLALRGRFGEHRALARWTFPIWAYVSVTGVVVYLMLYHLAPAGSWAR
jgi:putative membrane protein